ncbi:guanine nucleotide-binding protein-like 1 isoform X3 [Neodiprion lecontei]|uniref:Guanine nucleotide-binding protein-like 1 n=1 Tax=Neodiprion lecontei TaxID=441921 RepID=A0ABM3FLP4_NEOLC|nr:guanine nucleotide-binding protein-like 1 isoform X3 [Neodiprion pinetum]XP_046588950.1 guanine nucleotide-binding protein-like 1 isoform X3 [Neodiprion lecontei]
MLIVKTLWSVWSRTCPARYRLLASTIEKKPTHFRGFFHLLGKDASDKMEWNPFVMQLGYNSLKCMRKRCFIVSSLNLAKTKDRGKDKKKQTKDNYSKNLTLRSSVGSIEQIPIPWESKEYELQELSQVVRKPKTLIIDVSAFPQVIPNIIQALAKSGMNLNPQQDGTTLFVPIPKCRCRTGAAARCERFSKKSLTTFSHLRLTCQRDRNGISIPLRKYSRLGNEYLKNIEKVNGLSYFELNLETWRQLWRVLEMSDILLIIVDIRYPVLTFPPYLYTYVTKDLGKNMILVLNKIDLAPAALVVAWREYFKIRYPKLHVLMFTSFPTYNLRDPNRDEKGLKSRRLKGKLKMAAESAQKLLDTCEQIVGDEVDLSSWRDKIREEMESEQSLDELNRNESIVRLDKHDTDFHCHERYKNGILTIGCIGTPNVGKSSLMNALMGRKVVSVSRTPGHTKHFQTIFLTTTVRLCDCPGLVFPSTVPKQLQILMGSFPIAQVKEPYTTVKFLAERLDLPRVLNIHHQEGNSTWSAMDICDGWAAKRSYLTARTARFDCYRSANSILRMALDGKICIYAYPIGWSVDKDKWEKHPDIQMVQWIQARGQVNDRTSNTTMVSTSDEEESSEQVSSAEEGSSVSLDEEQKPGQMCNSPISHTSSEDESDLPTVANRFTALTTAK